MDNFSPEKRSWIMRQVRSKNTSPEIIVRSILHRMGYRFRLHRKDLPGNPDIVLPRFRKVIFVHGCFWHGHYCKRGQNRPKTRPDYWNKKIEKNIERNKNALDSLCLIGWKALVIWECELKDKEKLKNIIKSFLEQDISSNEYWLF